MIYLDNAATTGYKPEGVIRAVSQGLKFYSANPGRSGHRLSVLAAEKVYSVREKLSSFFGASGAERVVFTLNCTHSVNIVLKGALHKGDRLIISNLEHNAVARPAFKLQNEGFISLDVFNAFADNIEEELESLLKPNTAMVFCTHASNVCGKVTDIEKIGAFCKKHGILFGVDAAQSAGVLPLNMSKAGIDFLCIAPHKGLYAPMGTGVLIAEKPLAHTIIEGGTGTASLNLAQPEDMPERLESGTVNLPGIMGIGAGIDFLQSKGEENVYRHEAALCRKLCKDLRASGKATVYCNGEFIGDYVPVVAFNLKGIKSEALAQYLGEKGIAVRGGYHCAPLAHKALGTYSVGAVRVSPGITTSVSHLEQLKRVLFADELKKYINNI